MDLCSITVTDSRRRDIQHSWDPECWVWEAETNEWQLACLNTSVKVLRWVPKVIGRRSGPEVPGNAYRCYSTYIYIINININTYVYMYIMEGLFFGALFCLGGAFCFCFLAAFCFSAGKKEIKKEAKAGP